MTDSDRYEPWEPPDISTQQTTQVNGLQLCPYTDWNPDRAYDEDRPIYIHYSIEWKIAVNNRAIMSKDAEQDLVLEPATHWEHLLEPKLKSALLKKKRPLVSDDTTVVVSVTDRKTRDLMKRSDETRIDWPLIQEQVVLVHCAVGPCHVNTQFQERVKTLTRIILVYLPVPVDESFQFGEEFFDWV